MRNIVNDPRFINERAEMMVHYQDKYYKSEETELIASPSGKFTLEIQYFEHEEGSMRFGYSKGIIKDINSNPMEVIYRNYSLFPYRWAELGGNEYLLCGLDYQGYSIVQLTGKETKHYVPEEANEGSGFCWAEIYFFQGKKLIAVDGCYWACPYELVFYDFANPMDLPYREIFRVEVDQITNGDDWEKSNKVIYVDEDNNEKGFEF